MPRVKSLNEQDLREHRLLVRIEELESEVDQLERLLNMAVDDADPYEDFRLSIH